MGSVRDWSCISHSTGANLCSHTQIYVQTYHLEAKNGSEWLEQESCHAEGTSGSEQLQLRLQLHHIGVFLGTCVSLNVCTCECNCVSSLIALTPSSVKWDGLPLSVFKRGPQRARDEMNWWIMQAVCEMNLLAVIETEEESHLTLNQKKIYPYACYVIMDNIGCTSDWLHPVYFKFVRPRLQFSRTSQHSFIVFF